MPLKGSQCHVPVNEMHSVPGILFTKTESRVCRPVRGERERGGIEARGDSCPPLSGSDKLLKCPVLLPRITLEAPVAISISQRTAVGVGDDAVHITGAEEMTDGIFIQTRKSYPGTQFVTTKGVVSCTAHDLLLSLRSRDTT